MDKPDRSSYTPLDFLTWQADGSLDIAPEFQRRKVWTPGARSYFIDTLIRQMPVPPIYIRVRQSKDKTRVLREVIDGQQRLSAILDYLEDGYSLSRTLKAPYAGKRFSQLDEDQQDTIRQYGFMCEVFQGISDTEVLEIFARLNTHSVNLNQQELRNGRFFGYFKQSSYSLAHEHLEFWRRNRIFGEVSIARMAEVELTSELLILQIDGLKDRKLINNYYSTLDDNFPGQAQMEHNYQVTVDAVNEALGDQLEAGEYHRPPMFYSLFGAVYHRIFGVPNLDLTTATKPLDTGEREGLNSAVAFLSEKIRQARQDSFVTEDYQVFVNACLRTTDNVPQRLTRIKTLYRGAFG